MSALLRRLVTTGVLVALLLPVTSRVGSSQELSTPPPVSGRTLSDAASILPADVLARVELLRDNLDLIRLFMGKPEPPSALLRVDAAQPREVYTQALNVQLRANRLAFEQLRVVRSESVVLLEGARPADVFGVTDAALATVLLVKEGLGIDEAVAEKVQHESTTPSEVFNAAITANSELDHLLEHRTSPSDVFQLVTAAVHSAAALHATIPDGPSFPREPAFEPNKRPADVYLRMQHCYELISEISDAKGLETLRFEVTQDRVERVSPNDVTDLAALVVEELHHLRVAYPEASLPTRAYYPGKRFPAHVFQRAGLLEQILLDLAAASRDVTAAAAGN